MSDCNLDVGKTKALISSAIDHLLNVCCIYKKEVFL